MAQVFRARWVVPVDGQPIENGGIAVSGDEISAVDVVNRLDGEVRDLGDVILLPGFVNAHTHLELSMFAGQVPAGSLWDWLDGLMALIAQESDVTAALREGVRLGARQSLAAGVTCVGDISRTGLNVEILRDAPIRAVCFLELISGGRHQPNDAQSLAAKVTAARVGCDPDRQWIGVSPHATYSVTPGDLAAAAGLSARDDVPLTMHLLEAAEEREWLEGNGDSRTADREMMGGRIVRFLGTRGLPTRSDPIRGGAKAIMQTIAAANARALFAHVNYVSDEEIALLAELDFSVAWCPRTHHFFRHAPHRWRDLLAAGVNVCVGTDSLVSNPDLSILNELRFLHRTTQEMSPADLIKLGTINAARGLGLNDKLGSLTPGKLADFVIIPLKQSHSCDPLRNLFEAETQVETVWIGGQQIK